MYIKVIFIRNKKEFTYNSVKEACETLERLDKKKIHLKTLANLRTLTSDYLEIKRIKTYKVWEAI